MRQASQQIQVLALAGASAAGQTVVTGTTIDTQGFDSLTVIAKLGAITATGVVTLKLQGGEAANGSDKTDIAGASAIATDAQGNKYLVVEIHRPQQRYITPVITRATANSEVVSVEALLYGASNSPVAQPIFAAVTSLVSPELA